MRNALAALGARARRQYVATRKSSVADKIDEIGFGSYQVQVFILSAGFIVAEGSELQMASGLTNAISADFGIDGRVGRSMLMTCTFLGFAAGTIASGPFGDMYGRRVPMLIGYVGVVCTACITYFVPTLSILYCLRFVLGFFGGIGIPTALITISEVSPKKLRGVSTAALGVAYCLGDIWAATGLTMVMPDLMSGPWRLLLFWAAVPATSLIIFGMLSPVSRYDTPYFLAANGRSEELVEALNLMANMNCKPQSCIDGVHELDHQAPKHAYVDFLKAVPVMARWPLSIQTLVLCILFFSKDFGYYGMGVFWPLAWAQISGDGIVEMSASKELLLTACLGIPGVVLAMLMMYHVNRRHAIAVGGVMCAVAAALVRVLDEGDRRGLVGVVLFKLFFPTWQMVTMLLPSEIFPTEIRAWAYASVALFGRIATITAPTVVESSHRAFLMTTLGLGLGSAVVTLAVLPETKDCDLICLDDPEPLESKSGKVAGYGATKI